VTRDRFGILDAVFSLKCFGAAMLAYYIALRIGLPRPFWAVTTAYIVSQPLAGAVLSKALFRVLGTILGAAIAVLLVPNFANAPELLTVALAIWLGLCVYFALLDRTPRSYIFLLAGYTASIIGFPSVAAPDAIFNTAILRVQEITLGILCASLVHGLVFPRTVTARLIGQVDAVLADAERWSADALDERAEATLDRDRRRLALDIFDMHQLSAHLPFDTARLVPRISVVRALQDQIGLILPLGEACLDRIRQICAGGSLPVKVETLLADCRAWLRCGARADEGMETLIARAAALEPEPSASWTSALTANLLARVGELVEAHGACSDLRAQLAAPHRSSAGVRIDAILRRAGRRPLHRDRHKAVRSAIGVSLAVILLSAIWIASAWPDGANAVLITGAVGAILASIDATPATGWKFVAGAAIATLVSGAYDFAILPRVTDFVPLVAVLAPAFLLMGGMMTIPATAPYALGIVVTLPTSIGLGDRYASSFEPFVNGNMAQLVGMATPVLTLALVATIDAQTRARHILAITRNELARRCLERGRLRTERWLATVLDRAAYLYPHVATGDAHDEALEELLRSARIGINIDELRQLRSDVVSESNAIEAVLRALHNSLRVTGPRDEALRGQIDRLLTTPHPTTSPDQDRRLSNALVGLRRSLFPDARAPVLELAR